MLRHLLPLLLLLIPALAHAEPAPDLLSDPGGALDPLEQPAPRDVLDFRPYDAPTPAALLAQVRAVDWWVERTVLELPAEAAHEELLALHLQLLKGWLEQVPPQGPGAPRDEQFDPAVTVTEKVLLAWEIQPAIQEDWRALKDRALDVLRLGRAEEIAGNYQAFCAEQHCAASPRQVQLFVRMVAAHRASLGGPSWARGLIDLYAESADEFLAIYPAFAKLSQVTGRSTQLEELYESPLIAELAGPLGATLEILAAMGPEGYAAIAGYRTARGSAAFLPFPERIALIGGGAGLPLLVDLLGDPSLAAEVRQAMLAVALEHANGTPYDTLNWPRLLLAGEAPMGGYAPEQLASLAGHVRELLLSDALPDLDGPAVTFTPSGEGVLHHALAARALLLLTLPDAEIEITGLLINPAPEARGLGLAAVALWLEDPDGISNTQWEACEDAYLRAAVRVLLDPASDPDLQSLALLVVLRLMPSTGRLEPVEPWLVELAAALATQRHELNADGALRRLTLDWMSRQVPLTALQPLLPIVVDYAESLDSESVSLDTALELLKFHQVLADSRVLPEARPDLEPLTVQGLAAAALDQALLLQRLDMVPPVRGLLESERHRGNPVSEAVKAQIRRAIAALSTTIAQPSLASPWEAEITALTALLEAQE
ncbi:MAG TPA: hypothetical protein VEI97_19860 [bacterium]|nr:hypothetical protein [bacterium]